MGSPDNSAPPRPREVPPDARWDPKDAGFEWVKGDVDGDGRRHGFYQCWTRDGRLHGECTYEHGNVHGTNKNFHPDGPIASEAAWVHGVIMDSAFFRSARPSPSTSPFTHSNPASFGSQRASGGTSRGRGGAELSGLPIVRDPEPRWRRDQPGVGLSIG